MAPGMYGVAVWDAAAPVSISLADRHVLERWVRAHGTPQGIATRAGIILKAAEGLSNNRIAMELGVSRPTVIMWRGRFAAGGTEALTKVKGGRGRKPTISPEKVRQIVEATTQTKPKAQTHWSVRSMAEAQGVSPSTVARIWDAAGLAPHRVETFKLSTDKRFLEKLTDVVGLYLNPPDKAVVLCVDEKTQIQALDRTQPVLPMGLGYVEGVTHDYTRHGTTTLFAALDIVTGHVLTACKRRHRHQEYLAFLQRVDDNVPRKLDIHLVVDNYATHKHPRVKRWLAARPRYHVHYTPTYASWLNQVEIWFNLITQRAIRRGTFKSVKDLVNKIDSYVQHYNTNTSRLRKNRCLGLVSFSL